MFPDTRLTLLAAEIFVIAQSECFVFIPEESINVSSLLNHMRIPVNSLRDQTPSSGDLQSQWFGSWCSEWKMLTLILGIGVLICVFIYDSFVSMASERTVTKKAISMLLKPLADLSGHTAVKGGGI